MAGNRFRRPTTAVLIPLVLLSGALILIGLAVQRFSPAASQLIPGRGRKEEANSTWPVNLAANCIGLGNWCIMEKSTFVVLRAAAQTCGRFA